jgi:GT2 family glycosyltransferase
VTPAEVSVAIPTYGREDVLLATIEHLLAEGQAAELLLLDQTPEHTPEVDAALRSLDADGRFLWLRLARPSIPAAMNEALRRSRRPLVLFLDDDIIPGERLVAAHAACYDDAGVWAVSGQVLQPGQEPASETAFPRGMGLTADLEFPFNSTKLAFVENCMAGNLSVRRERSLEVGGFDENFVGAAYRFETEFCRRLRRGGGRIRFEPTASVRHLRAASGGVRVYGDHRASASPVHGVGDYYFALRHGRRSEAVPYVLRRPFREVCSRFHLSHPWWIPVKLVGELRAIFWALRLARRGPKYVGHGSGA